MDRRTNGGTGPHLGNENYNPNDEVIAYIRDKFGGLSESQLRGLFGIFYQGGKFRGANFKNLDDIIKDVRKGTDLGKEIYKEFELFHRLKDL